MQTLFHILSRPDNLPIVVMLPATALLLLFWWHAARRNDRRLERGGIKEVARAMEGGRPAAAEDPSGASRPARAQLHTWPYLVRVEALAALAVITLLTVWSILVDAPLEQLADPSRTPNPSKAPWYFLGLQEMLVYFDPWIAGVALPLLIILGLCAIPYLDPNPRGSGYYCFKGRPFAIITFLVGLVGLWIPLILVGVFCRGPGWHWFWPWQAWRSDLAATEPATLNWAALFGVQSTSGGALAGAATIALYYGSALLFWLWRRRGPTLSRMGGVRYALTAFLLLTMLALPIKILLRQALAVKYVLVTPWFNI